jgi:putative hydrolase of the HAD superfamily
MVLIQLELQPMPGLTPLLDDLRRRELLLAVASNSPAAYVQQALQELHLEACFSCVRGVDQVRNPKPAPDVYLAAAACLQVSPGECIAIEDSLSGVQAALDAQMECLLVPSHEGELDIPEDVRAVFPTLADLQAEIEEILSEL